MLPNEVFVLREYKYTARFCDAVLPFYDFWEYKRSARYDSTAIFCLT